MASQPPSQSSLITGYQRPNVLIMLEEPALQTLVAHCIALSEAEPIQIAPPLRLEEAVARHQPQIAILSPQFRNGAKGLDQLAYIRAHTPSPKPVFGAVLVPEYRYDLILDLQTNLGEWNYLLRLPDKNFSEFPDELAKMIGIYRSGM